MQHHRVFERLDAGLGTDDKTDHFGPAMPTATLGFLHEGPNPRPRSGLMWRDLQTLKEIPNSGGHIGWDRNFQRSRQRLQGGEIGGDWIASQEVPKP